jgi:hypothetical protein
LAYVPLFGDIFAIALKADRRNDLSLSRHLEAPHRPATGAFRRCWRLLGRSS